MVPCGTVNIVARCKQYPCPAPDCGLDVGKHSIPTYRTRPVKLGRTKDIIHPEELFGLMWVGMPHEIISITNLDGRATPLVQSTNGQRGRNRRLAARWLAKQKYE